MEESVHGHHHHGTSPSAKNANETRLKEKWVAPKMQWSGETVKSCKSLLSQLDALKTIRYNCIRCWTHAMRSEHCASARNCHDRHKTICGKKMKSGEEIVSKSQHTQCVHAARAQWPDHDWNNVINLACCSFHFFSISAGSVHVKLKLIFGIQSVEIYSNNPFAEQEYCVRVLLLLQRDEWRRISLKFSLSLCLSCAWLVDVLIENNNNVRCIYCFCQ